MKMNDMRLQSLLSHLDSLEHIDVKDIPQIDLYMDQVTTFMEKHLADMKRYPDDKILTKNMINNYAKNNLLPPPVKKRYNQEHILLLIFIYYFKNMLSFNDMETILSHITEHHFGENTLPLSEVYTEIFSMGHDQMAELKKDVAKKFKMAGQTFQHTDVDESGRDALQLFAFICELAFDVYLKKQMIERLTDEIRAQNPPPKKK